MALEKYDEVNDYLHSLNDELTNVDATIKTGRVMVDAILNGKINIAAQNIIPVNAKAKRHRWLNISNSISNLSVPKSQQKEKIGIKEKAHR